jgi:hypothetical protein
VLSSLAIELNGAGERPVVGEPDGGHLELSGACRERGNAAGSVEDRELGVDVKMYEGRFGHGNVILSIPSADTL